MSNPFRAGSEGRELAGGGIALFFAWAFGITWLLQFPAVLAQRGVIPGPMERFLLPVGLGIFGPLLAAVLTTRYESGRAGVRALFQQLRAKRAGVGWYVVALCLPGTLFVVGALTYELMGGNALRWFYPPDSAGRVVATLVISFGEEVGWRGFALPRLQARYGALTASVVLGVLWATWHIPMFLLAGLTPQIFLLMLPFFVSGSIVFTWLYNRTRAGLVLAILAHVGAHLNNTHQPLPADVTPLVIHTVAYSVFALGLVFLGLNRLDEIATPNAGALPPAP